MTTSTLNQGQQAAAEGFFSFLFGNDPSFIISGPAGTGKTHLMSHLIDIVMPQYESACHLSGIKPEFDEVVMTATTNKASEVLAQATKRPTSTIHSFLNLKVFDDYSTGKSTLKPTGAWKVHQKKILFIDEASTIDTPLRRMVFDGTCKSKVIFVGDHCQLGPVMEDSSPIYKHPSPFYHLTESMRNAGQPALMALCAQLRETVETGVFRPIKIVPGVIDHLEDNEMAEQIALNFTTQTHDSRILAYTNNRVIDYNDHIRALRGLPHEYTVGEFLVNNTAMHLPDRMFSVEEEVTIVHQSSSITMVPIEPGVELAVRYCDLETGIGDVLSGIALPVDRGHFHALLAYYKKAKNWPKYYWLKDLCPDLRQRDASTFHKAQGSTYESVFIDLTNLSTCHQPKTVARMLYVAVSRPRSRIFLYGKLADKYGGLTA